MYWKNFIEVIVLIIPELSEREREREIWPFHVKKQIIKIECLN